VKLAAVGARVTVVAVWATTCGPCIQELPYIEALFESFRGDPDVAVLSVTEDDFTSAERRAAVRAIVEKYALQVPVLFDRGVALYRRINGEEGGKPHVGVTIPLLAVIDPTFHVRRSFGFRTTEPIDAFVREQRALVSLALEGRVPPEDAPVEGGALPPNACGQDE
jgi:thiol-disulfide isomerase/thioredoxin